MSFEVELKFPLANRDKVRAACRALGAQPPRIHIETDTYLRHPGRSFERTDEALRVRKSDDGIFITYKGPKVDPTTKTRVEIELPLRGDSIAVSKVIELWNHLGFSVVRDVRKDRETLTVPWHGRPIQVCLDRVDGLGEFVELEIVSEAAQLEESRQLLKSLAVHFGLTASERRSYLEMLLEKDAVTADTAQKSEDWAE